MVGRGKEAQPLADAAIAIGEKQFGEKSLFAGAAHRARAYALQSVGDFSGARVEVDKAAEIFAAMGKGGEVYIKALEPLRNKMLGK